MTRRCVPAGRDIKCDNDLSVFEYALGSDKVAREITVVGEFLISYTSFNRSMYKLACAVFAINRCDHGNMSDVATSAASAAEK